MKKIVNEKIMCACGCKEYLDKFDVYGRTRKFIHGHNMNKNHPTNPLLKKCRICGKWDFKTNLNARFYHNGCRRNIRNEDREYRMTVEKVLGKKIPIGVQVHHIDGNRLNNLNNNLVVCESKAYHFFLHTREKALKNSGDVNKRRCIMCGEYDDISMMRPKLQSKCKEPNYYHIECSRMKRRESYIRNKLNRFATEEED